MKQFSKRSADSATVILVIGVIVLLAVYLGYITLPGLGGIAKVKITVSGSVCNFISLDCFGDTPVQIQFTGGGQTINAGINGFAGIGDSYQVTLYNNTVYSVSLLLNDILGNPQTCYAGTLNVLTSGSTQTFDVKCQGTPHTTITTLLCTTFTTVFTTFWTTTTTTPITTTTTTTYTTTTIYPACPGGFCTITALFERFPSLTAWSNAQYALFLSGCGAGAPGCSGTPYLTGYADNSGHATISSPFNQPGLYSLCLWNGAQTLGCSTFVSNQPLYLNVLQSIYSAVNTQITTSCS